MIDYKKCKSFQNRKIIYEDWYLSNTKKLRKSVSWWQMSGQSSHDDHNYNGPKIVNVTIWTLCQKEIQ